MTHNQAAVDLIATRLATGLIHPGDPDTGRPPTPILLPGLSSTGIPAEMAQDFARIAGLPTNDAPQLLAEAIVALIETELAGGSTIIPDAEVAAMQQAIAEAPSARILSVHCTCDTTQSDPLIQLAATNSDRIVINGKTLLTGLAQRSPNCPHAVTV